MSREGVTALAAALDPKRGARRAPRARIEEASPSNEAVVGVIPMRRHLPVLLLLPSLAVACAEPGPPPAAHAAVTAATVAPPVAFRPASGLAPRPAYPPSPKRAETITAGGVALSDDYAWLRDPESPEVSSWIDAENAFTTASLAAYPHLVALRARFQELTKRTKPALNAITSTPAGFFGLRRAPTAPQPSIVLLASLDTPDKARVVLDPTALDPSGQTAIDWFVASRDGKRIAVSLSKSGSEDGSLSIFDVASGKLVDGPIARVQYPTGGGSAAFTADGAQIFYTRYPAPGEAPAPELHQHQALFRHTIGAPLARDERVSIELPAIAEIALEKATRNGTIVGAVHVGDGGDRIWLVGRPSGAGYAWSRFAEAADGVAAVEVTDDALFVLSRKSDLRGAVLRVPTKTALLADATVVVPASDRELTTLAASKDVLVAFDIAKGSSRARAFRPTGGALGEVALPARATVDAAAVGADGTVYLDVVTYTTPLAVHALDAQKLTLRRTNVFVEAPVSFDDLEVSDEVATSRDGTPVPITILAKRGAARGPSVPALLGGYGGYGIAMTPSFDARRRVWLDQGGIVAIAHLRGGNDQGEAWHRAGKLDRKQNVFDDFIACADRLVAAGYTSREKLAITGRSNGGLLMGAVLVQRPDLARAAVIGVPILDMARFEELPNGVFNTTEFGSIKDPAIAPKLLAYSPFQNARAAAYPSILFISGKTDGRVNPADARELTAKLQAISTSEHPILLRTWMDSGHGMGTNVFKRAEEDAQAYAFLFHELDVPYRAAE